MELTKLEIKFECKTTVVSNNGKAHEVIIRNWTADKDLGKSKPTYVISVSNPIPTPQNVLLLTWEFTSPNSIPHTEELMDKVTMVLPQLLQAMGLPVVPTLEWGKPWTVPGVSRGRPQQTQYQHMPQHVSMPSGFAQMPINPGMVHGEFGVPGFNLSHIWDITKMRVDDAGYELYVKAPHFPSTIVLEFSK